MEKETKCQRLSWRKNRIEIIDAMRGAAVFGMLLHHLLYDIRGILGIPVPILNSVPVNIILTIGAGIFIFLCGISTQFSRKNLRRGIILLLAAAMISLITINYFKGNEIYFGILHLLGISIIIQHCLSTALGKIPDYIVLGLFLCLFAGGYVWYLHNQHEFVDISWLFPLGFVSRGFRSADYFPMIPWSFLLIAGSGMGRMIVKGSFPKWFYTLKIPLFPAMGRHTLWIYLLHQPLFIGIIYIVKALFLSVE